MISFFTPLIAFVIVFCDVVIADLMPLSCVSILDVNDVILVLISLLSVRHKTRK